MTTSSITAVLPYDIKDVWEVVTSLEDYTWRSDLSQIEIINNGEKFIEYANNGFPTTFTITAYEPMKKYEFNMENSRMTGHWIGTFSANAEKTTICFTEYITAKKLFIRPFVSLYLKMQQKQYMDDLQKKLSQIYNREINENI